MAYDGRILRRARERFEADREARRARFEEQRAELFRRQPRLREVDARLRSTTGRILSTALRKGTDPLPALERLRAENLGLQAEKRAILENLRLPASCLEETPACTLCGDTGYRGGEVCQCLRAYYAREQRKELSRMLDLGSQRFETFSLDWYDPRRDPDSGVSVSPRENMEGVLRVCKDYARSFGREPENLLLFGAPGLGKTFLSAAIAREVSDAGFSVVYDTAGHIFERFEAQKFDRDDGGDADRALNCDLLILDDLGTEMTTSFVQSALYQIVNTRLLERRSTILNTNLGPEAISRRYTPQIASRLEGEYRFQAFFGEDIRKLKKERAARGL